VKVGVREGSEGGRERRERRWERDVKTDVRTVWRDEELRDNVLQCRRRRYGTALKYTVRDVVWGECSVVWFRCSDGPDRKEGEYSRVDIHHN
jgi:hypothetical protein